MLEYILLVGIFPLLVVVILVAIESTRSVGNLLDWVFIIFLPNYNMGKGVGNLYDNYEYLNLCLNTLPEDGFNMKPGKASLERICLAFESFGRSMPCCKGKYICVAKVSTVVLRTHFWVCLLYGH